ncbi:hypothetical protein RBB75_04920 [Tunturibacter empetritectus]|uniref:Uncharacterized protein n=1 Tax=Tunturiibacter empetritectus TaxID=3069691 RepID=A0AAU7ZF87_9BACT
MGCFGWLFGWGKNGIGWSVGLKGSNGMGGWKVSGSFPFGFAQGQDDDFNFRFDIDWFTKSKKRNAGVSPLRRVMRLRGSGRDDEFWGWVEMMNLEDGSR